jgi:hypothetical protein
MKRLTHEAFARARRFLKTEARPLDRALFEYRFEGSAAETVIAALAAFQNDDGGFGNALEPDLRTPTSSALATGIALRILRELKCPADHPLVRGAVQYLLATFDEPAGVWRVAPLDTNDHPHAPWWHDDEGTLVQTFDDFLVIPRGQLVAWLHHYASLVPSEWLAELTESTVRDIETLDALGTGGGDTLVYALHLAETETLSPRLKDRLAGRVRAVAAEAVIRDPEEWTGYCRSPLKVVSSPDSIIADLIWDDLQRHLDIKIDQQTPQGTWEPNWTWGEFYPEVWPIAQKEWRGELTLRTLTTLNAFGRLEL